MITESIVSVLVNIASFLIGLIPEWTATTIDGTAGLGTILAYGLYFFPLDIWVFVIAQAAIMMGVTAAYTIAEWVWKKIPGIN